MVIIRDTLDNFGVEVSDDIFQEGTEQDERRKVECAHHVMVM